MQIVLSKEDIIVQKQYKIYKIERKIKIDIIELYKIIV